MRAPLRHRLALVAILILATAVRAYHIASQSLWFDEAISAHIAVQPIPQVLLGVDSRHPPLYYLLLNLAAGLTGDGAFALRWPSSLLGVLTVALAYALARQLFGARAGLTAALLAACSPLLWWASQEIRMYSLLAALMLLAALAWHRLVGRGQAVPLRDWLFLWAVELLLLYVHNTGPIQALWLNAVTVLAWLVRRDFRRPPWHTWFLGQLALLLLWSPWLLTHFVKIPQNRVVAAPPQLGLELFGGMWQVLWTGPWAMVGREPVLVGLCALLFVLALLVIPWRETAARWLVVHVLVLAGGLVAGLIVAGITLHGRYLVMVAPLLIVALAGGVGRVGAGHAGHSVGPGGHAEPSLPDPAPESASAGIATQGRPLPSTGDSRFAIRDLRFAPAASLAALGPRLLPILAFTPFLLTSAFAIFLATHNPAYQHDDVRGMVQYYADTLGRQDSVLVWSRNDRFDLAYYWERLGVQARRVVLPTGADLDEVAPRLPQSGRIAVNVWFGERTDYRQMLGCALAHGAANPPAEHTVYGMSNLLFQAPPPALPAVRPLDGVFSVARVTGAGVLADFTAGQALCLPVTITLTQPTARDLKAALIAKNALGWEIARADALFARADQKTSSQLAPGAALAAYPLLWLPYGAPAGDYALVLHVYDESTLSGYDVLGAAGTPAGKDLALGTRSARAGVDWTRVSRTTDLPAQVALPAGGDLVLAAHNADGSQPIHNGSRIPLALLWRGMGPLPDLVLAAQDGAWRVAVPPARPGPHESVTLDWREARVPVDAGDGGADLTLPDGTLVARYTIQALPAEFVPPDFATPVGAVLPGAGELAGYTLVGTSFARSEPISITLVWRAGEAVPETSYTVFVQLLSSDGRLIAQSDAVPTQGTRPTTGWRPGEYIVDTHQVVFHPDAPPGPATLIVGLYDATTGVRLRFADGMDAVTLPVTVEVR